MGVLWWDDLLEGIRLYHPFGFLHPEFRKKGIGSAMWNFAENRIREIAAEHPNNIPKYFQAEPFQTEKDLIALLESHGYKPVRYETHMVRDLSEPFPEAPMPEGLDVRQVRTRSTYAQFSLPATKHFRDHWGSTG